MSTQPLANQALGWVVSMGIVAGGIVYLDELKTATRSFLGLPDPANIEVTDDSEAGDVDARGKKNSGKVAEDKRSGDGRTVELKAGSNGHFHASADINGRSIDVMVDTGASIVALTFEDAERAGVFVRDSDFTHRVATANGVAKVAPVTLDRVTIGDITVRDVRAAVTERGKLSSTLLGMSFLGKLSKAEMSRGVLVLVE